MERKIEKINNRINLKLIICISSLILILAKMYFFNNIFLIIAVTIMSLAIIIDKEENKPLYLFFSLPLIYVIKFSNDQISLFNILCMVYLLSMIWIYIKKKKKIEDDTFVFLCLILILILVNCLISDKFNTYSSIGWISNLIIFYFIIKNSNNKIIYTQYIYFFSISIAIVGICGIIFMNNTNISIYLSNMRRTNTVISNGELNYRYSGFDLDPNYFSLQALIAFWCLLIDSKNNNKHNYILLFILLIVGLATISKMYIITLAISIIFYLIFNIKNITKISIGKILVITLFLIISISMINRYILPVFKSRFEDVTNFNDLTTGRSYIWKNYGKYILNNLKVLFIGEGVGNGYFDGYASHSTYILIIYRLGVLGSIFFIGFICSTIKNLNVRIFSIYSIPLIVFMITNFALDILDFDSFSYLLILILGIYQIKETNKKGEK